MSEFFKIHKSELLHILSCAIGASYTNVDDAIERMKLKTVALAAEQQQQEPVAWQLQRDGVPDFHRSEPLKERDDDVITPLYTHPQPQVQAEPVIIKSVWDMVAGDGAESQIPINEFTPESIEKIQKALDQLKQARNQPTNDKYTMAEQPRAAVPDGWKLVPIEPTPEMIQVIQDETEAPHPNWALAAYRAMLEAAPAVPDDLQTRCKELEALVMAKNEALELAMEIGVHEEEYAGRMESYCAWCGDHIESGHNLERCPKTKVAAALALAAAPAQPGDARGGEG